MITKKFHAKRTQAGIAAVELALILPVILILLAMPLYLGRIFWHYSAAKTAAYDGARFLSSVPVLEIKDPTRVGAVLAVAQDIVNAEIGELNPGPFAPTVMITCDGGVACGGFVIPTTVQVSIQVYMTDLFFTGITTEVLGGENVVLTATVEFPYAGN